MIITSNQTECEKNTTNVTLIQLRVKDLRPKGNKISPKSKCVNFMRLTIVSRQNSSNCSVIILYSVLEHLVILNYLNYAIIY